MVPPELIQLIDRRPSEAIVFGDVDPKAAIEILVPAHPAPVIGSCSTSTFWSPHCDAAHVHHDAAHKWLGTVGKESWATCPITENGLVRVLSNPSYPTVSASVADVSERPRVFCSEPGHVFWSDGVSLRDETRFDLSRLRGQQQITDLYLAALAARQGGKLATFDAALPCHARIGGSNDLVEVISLA